MTTLGASFSSVSGATPVGSAGTPSGTTLGASFSPAPGATRAVVGDGSGTSTSSTSITLAANFATPAAPETIVKSFLEAFQDRRDQRLEQLRNPPGRVETASVCWGKAPALPQSSTNPSNPDEFGTRAINRKPTEPPEDPDQDKTIRLTERRRKVEKIKVTAQDDKEVFVVVERMLEWTADGSDGQRYLLKFNPKGPKDVVAGGGSS